MGILPDPSSAGAVVYRDINGNALNPPDVTNAYSPPATFVVDCPLTALPNTCEARIEPRQINAIVSELISLAECFDPNGPWQCTSITNLCATFGAWKIGNVDTKVDIAGDTMTGPLILFGNPTDPLGAATKQMVDLKEDKANKGQPNGYVPLDSVAKISAVYLPSYVDDVVEYPSLATFPTTGETGLIYVALDTGKIYRWSGSAYVEISPTVIPPASSIPFTPVGTVSATDVQAAIAEVDAEKAIVGSTLPLTSTIANAGVATTAARSDHVHPSFFRDAQTAQLSGGADLNQLLTQGFYSCPNPVNGPGVAGETLYYVRSIVHSPPSTLYCTQYASTLSVTPQQHFSRTCINNAWSAWTRVLDSWTIASIGEYLNRTAAKLVTTDVAWDSGTFITLTDGATVTPDFSQGYNFQWALAAAGRTLANPINFKPTGGQSGMIYITPGASGTITGWGTAWRFAGGIKPVLTPSGVDAICYTVRSSTIIVCTFIPDVR